MPVSSFRLRRLPAVVQHILSVSRLSFPLMMMSACLPVTGQAAPALPDAGMLSNQTGQTLSREIQIPELSSPDLSFPAADSPAVRERNPSSLVTLKHIRLTGAPESPSVPVDAVLQKYTGRPLSFSDLRTMTASLTRLYRDAGLMVARVIIPPQVIRNGELSLTVLPGRADRTSLSNTSPLRESMLTRLSETTLPEGSTIMRDRVERLALLLNEQPGVDASVSLRPGEKNGTTTVRVEARPGKRFGGYIGLDNQSAPSTGRSRVLAGVYANSLLGMGDQLRLDGSLGYEHGGLVNGRLDYSQLISGYGTRAGMAYSRLDYQYDFVQQSFRGYSDTWEAYVIHPLVRTGQTQVNLRASAGQSFLTDKYPGAFAQAGTEGRKSASTGTLGVAGSMVSVPGGVTGASLSVTAGKMHYRDDTARFWSGSDIRGTEGSFVTFNYQLQHEQQIYAPLSGYVSLRGQETSTNLDASRKFLLGGPSAVRAYDVGAGAVDRGLIATAELKTTRTLPAMSWTGGSPFVTVGMFYDYGQGEQNRDNTAAGVRLTDKNEVKLGGGGLYVTVGTPGNYAVTATWAHATSGKDPVSGVRDDDRIWLSAVRTF